MDRFINQTSTLLLAPPSVRQTAAEVLAAAVAELCPSAFNLEGRATLSGFAYDFCFQEPFSKEMLVHLEDRMQHMIQENFEIKHREMVPNNAFEFLRALPRYYPSLFAKEHPGPLVDVFEMEGFFDLCPAPYARSTGEIGVVKLLKMTKRPPIKYRGIERQVIRIEGVTGKNKQTLKQLLKDKQFLLNAQHQRYGMQNAYFFIHVTRGRGVREVHRCFWLDKGETIRDTLNIFWRRCHKNAGYQLIHTQGNNLLENHETFFNLIATQSRKTARKLAECSRVVSNEGIDRWEGLFDSKDDWFDRAHILCSKENVYPELFAALQFMQQTLATFYFETEAILFTSDNDRELKNCLKRACCAAQIKIEEKSGDLQRVLWKVIDHFGNKRGGPFLELRKGRGGWIIVHSLFYRWSWFIASMIEGRGAHFEKRVKDIAKKTKLE